jgi:ABC-type transport system involved in multi-copper enzyme maturation permease subunit
MGSFFSLVRIFFSLMIRSKALWVICAVVISMVLINFYIQSQMNEWLEDGMTYDMATQRASNNLNSLAEQVRSYSVLLVTIVSALIAPASRKNGTTQFVLSMQVTRLRLSVAQYAALAVFIASAVMITHLGFCIVGLYIGSIGLLEVLIGWMSLLLPLLIMAAISFSLSTAFSSIVVYLTLFGIPFLLLPLLDTLMQWKGKWIPVPVARLFDNLGFLFPDPEFLMFWPHLSPGHMVTDPPFPIYSWSILNFIFSAAFWVFISYYLFANYNIGSRQPLK